MVSRVSVLASAVGAALVGLVSAAPWSPAAADVLVTVDKSTQKMTVEVDGRVRYQWPVSTGQRGYDTPSGSFKAFRMEADHFSKEWDDAPMPHSIFFTYEGHAIHGSYAKTIGQPASHGCVRLAPENAATLFALVKEQGVLKTKVVLTGETPAGGGAPAVAKRSKPRYDAGDTYGSYDDDQASVERQYRDTYRDTYAQPRRVPRMPPADTYYNGGAGDGYARNDYGYYGGRGVYDNGYGYRNGSSGGRGLYQPNYAPRPRYDRGWSADWD